MPGRDDSIEQAQVVGRAVERFDDHLGTTNRLMESVAAEQERLPALITELTSAASASLSLKRWRHRGAMRPIKSYSRTSPTLRQL